MSAIIHGGIKAIFGIIPYDERPKLPDDWKSIWRASEWALAVSPDGQEWFIGTDCVMRSGRNPDGTRFIYDEREKPISEL